MKSVKVVTEQTSVCQNIAIPSVNLDGEVGMMNISKGLYYSTDEVGTRIWELISEPKMVRDLIITLLSEYAIAENICREHVLEFVNELYKQKLVVIN